jgi:murein DD-endopeptidase MepM/ murein hydrolase activator NlpD
VIIDHGLGIFSLYGHLSAITVKTGQEVQRGDVVGRTGETGLAGGDHLHFSIMLYGVHVDPVEWWDGKWIRDHVTAKLEQYPRATVTARRE